MWIICGHDDRIPAFQVEGFARNNDLGITFHNMDKRIERCSMFAQFLACIESEQGNMACVRFGDLAVDDGTGLDCFM